MKMQTFIGILIIGLLLVSSIGDCIATINYTYDNLNRLIEVDHGNGTVE